MAIDKIKKTNFILGQKDQNLAVIFYLNIDKILKKHVYLISINLYSHLPNLS